jgi:hypothetical protein
MLSEKNVIREGGLLPFKSQCEKVNIGQIVTKLHELCKLMSPITSAVYVSEVTFLTNVSLSYAIGQEIKELLSLLDDRWFLVKIE